MILLQVKREGSVALVLFIAYLVSNCGLALGECLMMSLLDCYRCSIGLTISMLMSSIDSAVQLCLGISFPLVLLGGNGLTCY